MPNEQSEIADGTLLVRTEKNGDTMEGFDAFVIDDPRS